MRGTCQISDVHTTVSMDFVVCLIENCMNDWTLNYPAHFVLPQRLLLSILGDV